MNKINYVIFGLVIALCLAFIAGLLLKYTDNDKSKKEQTVSENKTQHTSEPALPDKPVKQQDSSKQAKLEKAKAPKPCDDTCLAEIIEESFGSADPGKKFFEYNKDYIHRNDFIRTMVMETNLVDNKPYTKEDLTKVIHSLVFREAFKKVLEKEVAIWEKDQAQQQAMKQKTASQPEPIAEPIKTEPVKLEPAKPIAVAFSEPAKSEPAVEPVTEPVKSEPIKSEPLKLELIKNEPVAPEPVKAEPAKIEPVKVEPKKTEKAQVVEPSSQESVGSQGEFIEFALDVH